MSFTSLGLGDDLLAAVADQGYHTPSPIQAQAIPAVLSGRDVMAAAQTGTGKTAGFTLPLLERLRPGQPASHNQVRALVLTPTRELAAQVAESVATYGKHLPLTSTVVFGGVKINPQMQRLRGGADILVATPGRLLDLYQQNAVKFDRLEVLVLDEADRMLDMGFIHDIRKILSKLPPKRQNLMFSATFSPEIRALAKGLVNDPVEIDVSPRNTTTELVTQWIAPVDKKRKAALLTHLIQEHGWFQVLVFSRTKHGANKLAKQLDGSGYRSRRHPRQQEPECPHPRPGGLQERQTARPGGHRHRRPRPGYRATAPGGQRGPAQCAGRLRAPHRPDRPGRRHRPGHFPGQRR